MKADEYMVLLMAIEDGGEGEGDGESDGGVVEVCRRDVEDGCWIGDSWGKVEGEKRA